MHLALWRLPQPRLTQRHSNCHHLSQPSPAQPSPAQPSPAQPRPAQHSPAQPSPHLVLSKLLKAEALVGGQVQQGRRRHRRKVGLQGAHACGWGACTGFAPEMAPRETVPPASRRVDNQTHPGAPRLAHTQAPRQARERASMQAGTSPPPHTHTTHRHTGTQAHARKHACASPVCDLP